MRRVLFGAYVCVCLAALVWPGYALCGNRIEPYVLGLPLSFAWNVGWVIATFVVLAIFHLTGPRAEPEG